eukprot:jgi/Mesen1/8140/ME000437S07234
MAESRGVGRLPWPPEDQSRIPRGANEEMMRSADEVIARARAITREITTAGTVPNEKLLHSLAAILEREEERYFEQAGHLHTNTRSSYTIGRLENDELYDLVSSRLLLEPGHSLALRAAAARLLLACVSCWMWVGVSEEDVNLWGDAWVERERLRTYATGLLAVAVAGWAALAWTPPPVPTGGTLGLACWLTALRTRVCM